MTRSTGGASPYLRDLRTKVGHDLLLLPAVTVLIRDEAARLLLVRSVGASQWGTLGGMIEPGESPQDAAVREVREEIECEVELLGIRDAVGGPAFEHTYPNGDQVAYVSVVFDARIVDGTVVPDQSEIAEARWFTSAELAETELNSFAAHLLR